MTQPSFSKPPVNPVRKKKQRLSLFHPLILLSLIAAIIALVLAAMAWEGSNILSDKNKQQLAELDQHIQKLDSTIQKNQGAIQQMANKDVNVDEHIALAEASYLIRLAQLKLHYGHNNNDVNYLLTTAHKRLQNTHSDSANTLKSALQYDIAHLQELPSPNKAKLLAQIDVINKQVIQLSVVPKSRVSDQKETTPLKTTSLDWWSKLKKSLVQFKQFIVIKHLDSGQQLPHSLNQLYIIKQNALLKIVQAQWALLNNNQQLFTTNLSKAAQWLSQLAAVNAHAQQLSITIQQLAQVEFMPKPAQPLKSLQTINQETQTNTNEAEVS